MTNQGSKIIGYRRITGNIGMSDNETGHRGVWLEKRRALWENILALGHVIKPLSPLTRASEISGLSYPKVEHEQDILCIEFGGLNKVFFEKELAETAHFARKHCGKVVFLCDDPDLFCPWELFIGCDFNNWILALNSPTMCDIRKPKGVKFVDLAFGSLLNIKEQEQPTVNKIVYSGRSDGRMKTLKAISKAKGYIAIYGKPEEWDGTGWKVADAPPPQPKRSAFYGQALASLGLASAKHKKIGWRTGRVEHSIAAGTPALIESDNFMFKGSPVFKSANDIANWWKKLQKPEERFRVWANQKWKMESQKEHTLQTLQQILS